MDEEKTEKNEREEIEKTETSIDNNPDDNISKVKEKVKKNPWMIVSIILGIAVIVLLVLVLKGGIVGGVIGSSDPVQNIVDYLNSETGGGIEYVSHEDLGYLYQVVVSYKGQDIPVYVTKDGKYFVQGAIPITGQAVSNTPEQTQETQEIPKSDKPKVELFVMTHCPYGTQAEKGLIPVLELFGDKVDSKIRFVHYFMHGDKEKQETYRQVCIREEQSDKYLEYLSCFLEAGDSERCLVKTKIDKNKLNSCISDKSKDYYNEDSELSQSYGVRGSPTLIINGKIVNSGRDSASFLKTICSAFNETPGECEKELSSSSPSPGFGYSASNKGSSGGSDAQCS